MFNNIFLYLKNCSKKGLLVSGGTFLSFKEEGERGLILMFALAAQFFRVFSGMVSRPLGSVTEFWGLFKHSRGILH